jgi:hypothetical protein
VTRSIFAGLMGSLVLAVAIPYQAEAVVTPPIPNPSYLVASDVVTFAGAVTPSGPLTWEGNSGTFTYGHDACGVASVPEYPPDSNDPGGLCTLGITSGTYVNQVCGTGTFSGSAGLDEGTETIGFSFTIYENGSLGVIAGSGLESDTSPTWEYGVVTLVPALPVPPRQLVPLAGTCATSLLLGGEVTVFDPNPLGS